MSSMCLVVVQILTASWRWCSRVCTLGRNPQYCELLTNDVVCTNMCKLCKVQQSAAKLHLPQALSWDIVSLNITFRVGVGILGIGKVSKMPLVCRLNQSVALSSAIKHCYIIHWIQAKLFELF